MHVYRTPRFLVGLLLTALGLTLGGTLSTREAAAQEDTPMTETRAPGWWRDRVFYQIFVRSFQDSDGDGIGDLQGIIDRLDELNDGDPTTTDDLGIGGIWLMPVMRSNSYHGYDVIDYEAIEPDYGTMEDFQRLVAEAHRRGIAVIIDLVINHTSSQHPWFELSGAGDPAFRDWYVWSPTQPDWRGPEGQQVWHREGDSWYYALFWGEMPDLNLANPVVTDAIYEVSRIWLEEIGVDGFRMDAIKHLIEEGSEQENTPSTHAWLRAYQDYLRSIKPDVLTVGEVWSTSYEVDDYIVSDELDLAFEFDYAATMLYSARQGNADGMRSMMDRLIDLYPPGRYATFLTNHDQNRSAGELRVNVPRGRIGPGLVAASLLLTSPGVPFIYYGEEIGLVGNKPDERIRTPMQWDSTPVTAGFTTAPEPWQPLAGGETEGVNVADQAADPASLYSHYRALIQLRNAHPALSTGDYRRIETDSRRVFASLRFTGDEMLLVLINTHDEPVSDYALTLESGPLAGVTAAEVLFGAGEVSAPVVTPEGGFSAYQPVPELAPFQTLILRLS